MKYHKGQALLEYALIVAIIGVAAITALIPLGKRLTIMLNDYTSQLEASQQMITY